MAFNESGTDVTITVIDVGVPVQSAVGTHAAAAVATFDATALSATSVPPLQTRRSNEVDTST